MKTHKYPLSTAIAKLPEMLFDMEGVLEGDTVLVQTAHGEVVYTVVKELPITHRDGRSQWCTLGKLVGNEKELELSCSNVFDFQDGKGPVPAHRHRNGGGWVADTASVADSAYVGPNAKVFDNAQVYSRAWVFGSAQIYGDAWVFDHAQVYGKARVFDHAQVLDNARVSGEAQVLGNAWVSGISQVYGKARVFDHAQVLDNARVSGISQVSGNALISGDAMVSVNVIAG